jgi:acyl-CoA synthetase (NDP forming)
VDFAGAIIETTEEVRVIEKLASLEYIHGIITNVPHDRMLGASSLAEQKKGVITAVDTFCNIPEKYGTPIITHTWGTSETMSELLKSARIPMYGTRRECALAMQTLVRYAQIKNRP